MTDSLKDEVREQLRSILTEVAQGGAKVLADPDVFDCAVKGGEIEIANLVLGVNELEWGDNIGQPSACREWYAQGAGLLYTITEKDADYPFGPSPYSVELATADDCIEWDQEFDTLAAAKAACQADYAKRIQSALTAKPAPVVSDAPLRDEIGDLEDKMIKAGGERDLHWATCLRSILSRTAIHSASPVVSDEMVEAAAEAMAGRAEHEMPANVWDNWLRDARAALTAALPHARTEADIRAEYLAELTELRERLHTKHSEIRAKAIEELRDSLEDDRGHMVPREWEALDVWQWLDSQLSQGEG